MTTHINNLYIPIPIILFFNIIGELTKAKEASTTKCGYKYSNSKQL
jgi:hypothetical protein